MIVCQFVLFSQSRVQFSSSQSSASLQKHSPHQHVSVNGTCRRTALPSALFSGSITSSRSLLCIRHHDRARLHCLCNGFIHFFKLNINNLMFICCPLVTAPDMVVSDISEAPFLSGLPLCCCGGSVQAGNLHVSISAYNMYEDGCLSLTSPSSWFEILFHLALPTCLLARWLSGCC